MATALAQRFPPPEFTETGHQMPTLTGFPSRALAWDYVDVVVLFVALALAAWLVLRRRSRRGVIALSIFSLLYFGFWRKGCVCSIGSMQNITQALFDSAYAVPLTVLAFGVLPLVFALFFGRVFCAAVCPHGAFQDLMLLRPLHTPTWLEHGLRLLAYVYLGLAAIFAATGGGYIICQYDPFIALFRLSGSLTMILLGVGFLAASLFIGRPYCRFLCPYGVLLGLAAAVARWRPSITPSACTQCSRCEDFCPFNAINISTPKPAPLQPPSPMAQKIRLTVLLLLIPIFVGLGLWLGDAAGAALARKHRVVNLAERVHLETSGTVQGTTEASEAFHAAGTPQEKLFGEAHTLRERYVRAGRLGGIWVGLVVGIKLLTLGFRRKRERYETDAEHCLACARCFEFCPQDQKWKQILAQAPHPVHAADATK